MPRTTVETPIQTKEQRKKLQPRAKPYWRDIDQGVSLGYRKGKRGGSWLVRRYRGKGDGKDYDYHKVGVADDVLPEGSLSYDAAVKRAKEIVEQLRRDERAAAAGPTLTVRNAVEDYMTKRDARESRRRHRQVNSDARSRLSLYVTGKPAMGRRKEAAASRLADIPLHALSEGDLLSWRDELPADHKDTTKKRLIHDLKAALNEAFASNRSRLPASLEATIRFGLRTMSDDNATEAEVAREKQVLPDHMISNIIAAAKRVDAEGDWDGDLLRMIVVLAATGARPVQAMNLRVRDVQPDKLRLMMPDSHKGRKTKGARTPVPIDASDLELLRPAMAGRDEDAPLLERWRSRRIEGGISWEKRASRGAWQSASELSRPWRLIREQADLADHIDVYALRHSSIVRRVRMNIPIHLVADMHDTSVKMIEDHYGRHIADALDELAARSVVRLIPLDNDEENVVRLARA